MSNTKYAFNVSVNQEGKEVYKGIPSLDRLMKSVPATGSFSVVISHENKTGSAKLFCMINESASALGISGMTQPEGKSWREVIVSKSGSPSEVTFSCDSKENFLLVCYALWIPALVDGEWHNINELTEGKAFTKLLTFIEKNGVIRLHTSGQSGRVIPLGNPANLEKVTNLLCKTKASFKGK